MARKLEWIFLFFNFIISRCVCVCVSSTRSDKDTHTHPRRRVPHSHARTHKHASTSGFVSRVLSVKMDQSVSLLLSFKRRRRWSSWLIAAAYIRTDDAEGRRRRRSRVYFLHQSSSRLEKEKKKIKESFSRFNFHVIPYSSTAAARRERLSWRRDTRGSLVRIRRRVCCCRCRLHDKSLAKKSAFIFFI